jgi:hypothetical protein
MQMCKKGSGSSGSEVTLPSARPLRGCLKSGPHALLSGKTFAHLTPFKTWGSRRGADLLLQVRAAVLNGEFDALLRPGSVSHAANEDQHDLLPLAA